MANIMSEGTENDRYILHVAIVKISNMTDMLPATIVK